ncbi:MAG: hypothetical protein H7222_17920 [Methylotenera sp.]|nr:hypothetical protein [Oligoflexia bacterium]
MTLQAGATPAHAADGSAQQHLREAQSLYQTGQYFRAARYAFAAQQEDSALEPEGYSLITLALTRAHLYNSASYFFIKTLKTKNHSAIRKVLTQTQELLVRVGVDVLRNDLIRETTYDDYDALNRSAFLYSLGKAALLEGKEDKAIGYLNAVQNNSPLWPYAMQIRASAYAIQGKNSEAIRDFKLCAENTATFVQADEDSALRRTQENEARDLKARCQAGQARTLYQASNFEEADQVYDHIPKGSFVYPDILFEQAWNSFGRREYNRSLGKLVSYKSPALNFVFNTEVDVLSAQSYLNMCLYSDANDVINDFNQKYQKVGEEVKSFVEQNSNNLPAFFALGKEALATPLHTKNDLYRMMNRFIRGPYFPGLVVAERSVSRELLAIRQFAQSSKQDASGKGFPLFLEQVMGWRYKTIRHLGGAFVKNSLMDYHSILIADFEKMAFIKLEMLGRAKDKILSSQRKIPNSSSDMRGRGAVEPTRRNDQFYWSFNGEFWNDELGDYVFGLASECSS